MYYSHSNPKNNSRFRYGTNFIQGKYCTNPHGGDGVRDIEAKRTLQYFCRRKNCPRHWRRYGEISANKLIKKLGKKNQHYFFVRLTVNQYCPKSREFECVQKFVKRLNQKYSNLHAVAIIHENTKRMKYQGHHFHLLIGTDQILKDEDVRAAWKSFIPNKKIPWHNRLSNISGKKNEDKEVTSVKYCVRYMFLGKKKTPCKTPPYPAAPKQPWRYYEFPSSETTVQPKYTRPLAAPWKQRYGISVEAMNRILGWD